MKIFCRHCGRKISPFKGMMVSWVHGELGGIFCSGQGGVEDPLAAEPIPAGCFRVTDEEEL